MKKNGYKILRKLHKLESRHNLLKYRPKIRFAYYSCKELIDLLYSVYGIHNDQYIQDFFKKSYHFCRYVKYICDTNSRINKSILSDYLTTYTKFFIYIKQSHIKFTVNHNFIESWHTKCLMSYIAIWGDN